MRLLEFFLLHILDLARIGFDLNEVRRPFDPDRFGWRNPGTRRDGLRRFGRARLELTHHFVFVRGGRKLELWARNSRRGNSG